MKTLNYFSISTFAKCRYLLVVFKLGLAKLDLIINKDRFLSISIQDLNLLIKIGNNSIMQWIHIIIVSAANIELIHLINAFIILLELVFIFCQVHLAVAFILINISKTLIFVLHLTVAFFLANCLRISILSMIFFLILVKCWIFSYVLHLYLYFLFFKWYLIWYLRLVYVENISAKKFWFIF